MKSINYPARQTMKAENPNCEENSSKHHTGKKCIESGCNEKAGTAWSPYWCWKHNAERLNRIINSLTQIRKKTK